MSKEYREVWKCMKCGEIMYGDERNRSELNRNLLGFKLHGCKNGDYGTGYLIGFEKQTRDK